MRPQKVLKYSSVGVKIGLESRDLGILVGYLMGHPDVNPNISARFVSAHFLDLPLFFLRNARDCIGATKGAG